MILAFEIIVILIVGVMTNWIVKRVNISSAAILVVMGILLGPSILGWVSSVNITVYQFIGEVAIILLLGVTAMKLGIKRLEHAGWAGVWVAILGMVFSFAGGILFARWWGSPNDEAIFVGTALTATSIGITIQVLTQFGLVQQRLGEIIIAAAVLDDVIALYILALAHSVLSGVFSFPSLFQSLLSAILIVTAIVLLSQFLARRVSLFLKDGHTFWYAAISVILFIIFALVTKLLGLSLVVGSFFAGLGLGEGLPATIREQLVRQLNHYATALIPFFFIIIGVQAQWAILLESAMLLFLIGVMVIAFLGKLAGGLVGAYDVKSLYNRLVIGVSMTPRGEVGLIIASIGLQQQHLSHHVFVALVLTVILTSFIAPLSLSWLARGVTRRIRQCDPCRHEQHNIMKS